MEKKISTPLTEEITKTLRAGDSILLSGIVYTARDAAHGRLINLLDEGKELPLNINGEVIYYVGPTPEKPGEVIGSAGPTTSYRMDSYAPRLLDLGLKGMIGKGARNEDKFYSDLEEELLDTINKLGIGPQGFGGKTTALGLNIETYPTHIAGLPVAVNINCHATRHKEREL